MGLITLLTKKTALITATVLPILIWLTVSLARVPSAQGKQQNIEQLYQQYAQEFPSVSGISVAQLQQLQQQGQKLTLVDVRSQHERAVSIIPGAITIEKFEHNLKQYQDTTVVAYCTIGYRSGKYAQKMSQQGIKILNLEGSLLAWSHLKGKLISDRGVTQKIHVFSRRWQLTARDYEAVW